jgi:D-psicose/D-tagatose/L-ribulose 3-epimerase
LGTLTGAPPTSEEKKTIVEVLGKLHSYAREAGVRLGVEPVNRYETYLYNTGADAAELIRSIGADNMLVHFDTYHMNIEEESYSKALKEAGPLAAYIHMSESHRGLPGEDTVDWDDVFTGLKEINYSGPLVLEAFARVNADLMRAACLWRRANISPESSLYVCYGMLLLRFCRGASQKNR